LILPSSERSAAPPATSRAHRRLANLLSLFVLTIGVLSVVATGTAAAQTPVRVEGRVVDARTDAPVASARVSPRGTASGGVETALDGSFSVTARAGQAVTVARLGYATVTLEPPFDSMVTVRLEPDAFDLGGITVTTARSPRAVLAEPANVTVLDRGQMDRRLMQTTEDLVRYLPGIRVPRQTSGTDPFNSSSGFKIRGVSGNRVQMLVDGSRVQERIIDGTRDLVAPTNLKAVEIVRGPASVLWGSDALGGLVAFETKDPVDYLASPADRVGFAADVSWSGLDQGSVVSVTGATRRGSVDALLSYARRDASEQDRSLSRDVGGIWPCTRAPEATPCDEFDPTDIGSDNVLGKVVWRAADAHRFELTGELFRRDTEVDQRWDLGPVTDFFGTVVATQTGYDRQQQLDRRRVQLEHEWRPGGLTDRIDWSLTYHPQTSGRFGERARELTGGDTEIRYDSLTYEETFTELDVQLVSTFETGAAAHTLTWGLDGDLTGTDYERVDVTRNVTQGTTEVERAGGFNFANADTRRADVYVQDEISLFGGLLRVTPALRLATYRIDPRPNADFQPVEGAEPEVVSESALTPKISVMAESGFLSAYAQFAKGFKMPTAQQLYTSLPGSFFVLVPNPELQPEDVDAWEVGVRAGSARGFLSVNGFFNDYTNFIQSFVFVPDTDPQEITFDNISAATIYGLEASAGLQVTERWSGTATLSWQRGDLAPDADTLVTQAFNAAEPLGAVVALRWSDPARALDLEIHGTFQADTERVSSPTVFRPEGYEVFGVVGSWGLTNQLTLRASVDNLLDTRYLLPTATAYDREPPSDAVAATNPIELQVQPGRSFRLGISAAF